MTSFGEGRITVNGKQVLLDGEHFADAVSPQAAKAIALCVHWSGIPAQYINTDDRKFMVEVLS